MYKLVAATVAVAKGSLCFNACYHGDPAVSTAAYSETAWTLAQFELTPTSCICVNHTCSYSIII